MTSYPAAFNCRVMCRPRRPLLPVTATRAPDAGLIEPGSMRSGAVRGASAAVFSFLGLLNADAGCQGGSQLLSVRGVHRHSKQSSAHRVTRSSHRVSQREEFIALRAKEAK